VKLRGDPPIEACVKHGPRDSVDAGLRLAAADRRRSRTRAECGTARSGSFAYASAHRIEAGAGARGDVCP